jgi:magnesium-dependent phosphatase 1
MQIFFDDESRNQEVATKLGVTFVLVPNGVNKKLFERGLEQWRKGRLVQ